MRRSTVVARNEASGPVGVVSMGRNGRVATGMALFILALTGVPAVWGAEGAHPGFGDATPLAETELAELRGGEGIPVMVGDLGQEAGVSGNTVSGSTNGENMVNGEAFAGSGGFAVLIQNSGNHVVIQNSTIVNLTIER